MSHPCCRLCFPELRHVVFKFSTFTVVYEQAMAVAK
jgi:hypothetical protein